jgi:hypothetical protein
VQAAAIIIAIAGSAMALLIAIDALIDRARWKREDAQPDQVRPSGESGAQ